MASMASETGPGVVQTPSGVGMQAEWLKHLEIWGSQASTGLCGWSDVFEASQCSFGKNMQEP